MIVFMRERLYPDWTMAYRITAHAVYDLKYHVVWITKYRKPVLRGEIAIRLRELIRQTCATLEVYIISGHVAADHVLLLPVPPHLAVRELVQQPTVARSVRRVEPPILGTAPMGARLFCRQHWQRDR
jgi:REP element-mobilizing transposase RayT